MIEFQMNTNIDIQTCSVHGFKRCKFQTYKRQEQPERVNVSLVVVRHRESNLWGHVTRRTRVACEFEGVVWLPGLWKLRSEPKVKELDIVPDIEPDIRWFL